MRRSRRILFFAEAVTLAHVARPIALAKGLDRARHEVVMACDPRYQRFLDHETWETLPLKSISSAQFLQALASGSPVYDADTLRGYVRQDLEFIRQVKPDLIVGDFRLSLSVSARLAGVPYAAVTNAYWSPHYPVHRFPLPALPMTRFLPVAVARPVFQLARPLAFGLHCKPLNRVRRENGLASLGSDLRRVYTDADHTLYADVPTMFPIENLPANHHYLGPVLWSPPVPLPEWWGNLPTDKPVAYLTLGSSGPTHLMQMALEALADQPVTVLASTAGAVVPEHLPGNVHVADYLPGLEAARRANLVICNGGSPTSQQALAAGVPVLGIASNMDQFLNMEAVAAAGAGVVLRADRTSRDGIRATVNRMLVQPDLHAGAANLASVFAAFDAPARFAAFVGQGPTVAGEALS
jgi:UDP:flavonoid glycosyltransferase YjiC (YdhE family)